MRRKERIDIFLKEVNLLELLTTQWGLFGENAKPKNILKCVDEIREHLLLIKEQWETAPDLRFSQVLIKLGFISNKPGYWYYLEEHEILQKQDVEPSKYMLWGTNFDKDMKRLPKTIWKPICELDTSHIHAILDGGFCENHNRYIEAFENELIKRDKFEH